MIPDYSETRAPHPPGSLEEQEIGLLRFSLMNKPFQLLSTEQRYIEAYEVKMSSGLMANSIQLLNQSFLLKDLKAEIGAQSNTVCEFLQSI